jgi:hypothetical protein
MNLAFAVGGLLFTGGSSFLLANQLQEEGWARCPETDATVLSASVCLLDDDNCLHIACVIYVYQVRNENYSGLCVQPFPTRLGALRFIEECCAQTPMTKYSPECPQESYLIVES